MLPVQYINHSIQDLNVPETSENFQFNVVSNTMVHSSRALISQITCLKFDPYQELLFAASSIGKVQSFYGNDMNNYTSFVVGNDEIRAMEVGVEAVITVLKTSIIGFKRQGLCLFEYSSKNFQDLMSIVSLPIAPNSILLGGRQSKIVQMDLVTQKEQRLLNLKDSDCLSLRADNNYIYNTDSSGNLTIRSLDSIDVIHTISAHTAGISDFDVSNNKIITCGYTSREDGFVLSEPFLKVYDIRNLRTFIPVPVKVPIVLCRFTDSIFNGRILLSSRYGQIMEAYITEPHINTLYQSGTNSIPTWMCSSSTKQCVAVGDDNGSILMLNDRRNATFNEDSWPTIFPSVEDCLPPMPIDSLNSSLACVPTPLPPVGGFCSDFWPDSSLKKQFHVLKPIPAEVLKSVRSSQSVLCSKNLNANTRFRGLNVCPYILNL